MMKKASSMSGAVRELVERYPMDYEFGLWDFKKDVFKKYPQSEFSHADTVSRRLREYRHGKDYDIVCVSPNKSRYKKVLRKSNKKAGKTGGKKK